MQTSCRYCEREQLENEIQRKRFTRFSQDRAAATEERKPLLQIFISALSASVRVYEYTPLVCVCVCTCMPLVFPPFGVCMYSMLSFTHAYENAVCFGICMQLCGL